MQALSSDIDEEAVKRLVIVHRLNERFLGDSELGRFSFKIAELQFGLLLEMLLHLQNAVDLPDPLSHPAYPSRSQVEKASMKSST